MLQKRAIRIVHNRTFNEVSWLGKSQNNTNNFTKLYHTTSKIALKSMCISVQEVKLWKGLKVEVKDSKVSKGNLEI